MENKITLPLHGYIFAGFSLKLFVINIVINYHNRENSCNF